MTVATKMLGIVWSHDLFTQGFLLVMWVSFTGLGLRLLAPFLRIENALSSGAGRLVRGRAPGEQKPFPHNGRLHELWAGFAQQCGRGTVSLGEQSRHLSDIRDTFTTEAVLERTNVRLAESVPGIMTAMGILGTFSGILIGLSGISISDASRVMAGVQAMLGGMSTAFVTSVWGIALSLLWIVALRVVRNRLQLALSGFTGRVNEIYPPLQPHDFIVAVLQGESRQSETLNAIHQSGERQRAVLQTLGTDIQEAFERTLNVAFADHFAPALDSMRSSVSQVTERIVEREQLAMGELVDSVRKKLEGAVGGHYQALADAMRTSAEVQQQTTAQLAGFLERLESTTAAQVDLLEATTLASEHFTNSTDKLAETHESIAHTTTELQGLVEASRILAADARGQAEILSSSQDSLRQHLAKHLDQVGTQVAELRALWLQLQQPLDELSTRLKDSMQEFSQFTAEKLTEIFTRFDSEMAQVVQHLSGTLAEIHESTLDLAPSTERLQRTFQGSLARLQDLERVLTELANSTEGLRDSTGQLAAGLPEHRDAITRLSERLTFLERASPPRIQVGNGGPRDREQTIRGDT